MKKYLFVAMLVFVVGALAMFAAFATDDAGAFSTGWTAENCGGCHNGGSVAVAPAAHPPTNANHVGLTCGDCHTTVPAIDVTNCLAAGCHVSADNVAAQHANVSGATCASCHPTQEVTTTTSEGATTTTEGGATTTTAGETTTTDGTTSSTTPPTSLSTTSTSPPTTSAPTGGTTSTTLRRATRPFTG